jgi:signal transduction histidine kinase
MSARLSVRQLIVPGAAIVALIASSVIAIVGAMRARDMEHRTVQDFAALAAYNYSGRALSMLANFSPAIVGAAGKRGVRTTEQDLDALMVVLDSLRTCCEAILPAKGAASGVFGDSSSVRFHVRSVRDAGRTAALAKIARGAPMAHATVRFATGGDHAAPFLYVVYPQYDRRREASGFVAIELDVAAAADSTFGALYEQRPALLPERLVGSDDNSILGEAILIDRDGRELFRTARSYPPTYDVAVPFGRDSVLQLRFHLSPAAARSILRGAQPGAGPRFQIVFASLSILLALLIAVTLRRAQRLARIRADFAASVTHELRTPLTQILLSAETLRLQRERSAGERRQFLSSIIDESRRLVHLIDNVLHFSRAERQILNIRPRAERLDSLVAAAVSGRAGVDFEPVAATAMVDADAFRLALSNVLDNAALHGSPRVRVRISCTGAAAEVIVEDSGLGIPVRERRRVLEPFVRLESARERHPTGSGIGLAVVAEVMRAMNGNVILEDAMPRGLRVRLVVPV